jgi:hypothetical protein
MRSSPIQLIFSPCCCFLEALTSKYPYSSFPKSQKKTLSQAMKASIPAIFAIVSLTLADIPTTPAGRPYCGPSRPMYTYEFANDGTPNCNQCRQPEHWPPRFHFLQCKNSPGTVPQIDHFDCDSRGGRCILHVSFVTAF